MEGYDFDVVGEDMQDFKCPICLMLLRDAFVMPCSHSACKLCLRKWAEQGNSGVYRCPSCQTAYDREKVGKRNEERLIDRVITTSLKVKCKQHFKTCDWIGTISDYECHEKTCLYTSVLCGYASCYVTVCRKDLKEHQDQCAYRTIQCEFCSHQFPYKELEDHHTSCDYFEVTHLQLCHGESMARKEVQAHIEYHCPNTEMKCPLHKISCNVTSSPHQKVEKNSLHGNANAVVKMKDTAKRNFIPNKEVKIKDTASNVDVSINDATAYKDGVRGNDTRKKILPAVKFHEDIHTFNELSHLMSNKENKRFVEKIISEPELALICNSFGESLLHSACYHDDTTCMVVLLKFGCPINHADKLGRKSIHSAAMNGSVAAAKMLFSIDQTLVNSINESVDTLEKGYTPLHYAAKWNKAKFVRFLLQQPGIKLNLFICYTFGSKQIESMIRHYFHSNQKTLNKVA